MRYITTLFFFSSTLLFAGNGTYFIGISPKSKAMGGTGVAQAMSTVDAAYKNPALFSELSLEKGGTVGDVGLSVIKQSASAENTSLGFKSSTAGLAYVPALSAAHKLCDNMVIGLSAYTYGGAKADFTGEATLQEVKALSSVTDIGPSLSYKMFEMWSIGIFPHFVYADLALNNTNSVAGTPQTNRPLQGTLGYGFKLGTVVTPIKDLSVGLSFSPKVRLRYKEVADLDALNLLPAALGGTSGVGDGKLDDIDTEDPAQVALGVAYAVTPMIHVTVDGRYIGWSSADVFRDLGWRDQYVLAIGGEYRIEKIAIRAGFNYARSVIADVAGENGFQNVLISGHNVSQQSVSNLDLVGFPGITTTHFSLGGGYDFSDSITGDLSFIYVPENTVTRSGTGVAPTLTAGPYSYSGKVSQWSIGVGGSYKF